MQEPTGSIYEFSARMLDGRTVSLDAFRGRVLLTSEYGQPMWIYGPVCRIGTALSDL